MSEESEIIEELRESYKKYGPVHPVIQTHCGTAAGETRKKAVPQWKVVRMEVRDYYEHLKLKASDNIHAQKPANWWRNIINEAAAELAEKQHIPKGEITKHLVLDFPLSERSIRRYLSDQFKQAEKIEAGRRGGSAAATVAAETVQEDEESSKSLKESSERLGQKQRRARKSAHANKPVLESEVEDLDLLPSTCIVAENTQTSEQAPAPPHRKAP